MLASYVSAVHKIGFLRKSSWTKFNITAMPKLPINSFFLSKKNVKSCKMVKQKQE